MKNRNDVQGSPSKRPSLWKRFFFIGIPLVMALLAGGIFLERYLGEQKLQEYRSHSGSRYADIQRQDLRLFAIPLAWSVRKELMRNNFDQIDEYFSELIKRKEFVIIMLVDPFGTIKVSSDRKLLGSSFSRLYPGMSLGTIEPLSFALPEGKSIFIVPVMGLNEKIGTIVFVYSYRELPTS